MLMKFYLPALRRHKVDNTIFQQDGAPPHYALVVRNKLEEKFGGRVISRGFYNIWPPYPDLDPCGFYLWGYLKSKLYAEPWRLNLFLKHVRNSKKEEKQ